ncbi:MAG: ACT domain-containing protein [Clostridia bacterium]|nr:ACT domain-containing protein [Clostridia bacterium]MDE6758590.1 ACT domain-containing protein [Clostridia bacterium]MDE7079441.1 ACT domain-containing protein [Clostridia bacterium]
MKAIVSVVGKDKKGIIAKVSACLFDMDINIENISQTIMQDYFTMIMAVDTSECKLKFDDIKQELNSLAEKMGLEIHIQLQSIFDSMHQIDTTKKGL